MNTNTKLNGILLIDGFSRIAKLAALRSIAGSLQYAFIGTADYAVRQRERLIPADPNLDLRNAQDEFARFDTEGLDGSPAGSEEIAQQFGFQQPKAPGEQLKDIASLYWSIVERIKACYPNEYERPDSFGNTLLKYTPRSTELSSDIAQMLAALEMEPGEFDAARSVAQQKRTQALNERKPAIQELFADHSGWAGYDEAFSDLPLAQQHRLMTNAWKGMYYRRLQLVNFITSSGKTDDIGDLRILQEHMAEVENWCRTFEVQHHDVLELLATERGIKVTDIDETMQETMANGRRKAVTRLTAVA